MSKVDVSLLHQVEQDTIDDHVFDLYTYRAPTEEHHLGYVDRSGDDISVHLDITGIDLNIKQSLSAFNSRTQTSSTGYVCWQTSINFADWLIGDPKCPLGCLLKEKPTMLELGAGSSGILASTLGSLASIYVATDHQKHLTKLLRTNTEANVHTKVKFSPRDTSEKIKKATLNECYPIIHFQEYDWEDSDAKIDLQPPIVLTYPDLIIASDTIYNEYLIPFFVKALKNNIGYSTVAIVALQLRDESIIESFLRQMVAASTKVYSVPHSLMSINLQRGFSVYYITSN